MRSFRKLAVDAEDLDTYVYVFIYNFWKHKECILKKNKMKNINKKNN